MKEIYQIYERPNEMITIVGSLAQLSAQAIESLIAFNAPSADNIMMDAVHEQRFVPLITDPNKIKTLVLTKDNKVYPSTFSINALASRIYKATTKDYYQREINEIEEV